MSMKLIISIMKCILTIYLFDVLDANIFLYKFYQT